MTLKLHNTLTGKLEDFKPLEDGLVNIYSCGPTVYDYPHVGNWFGYIVWDVLVRSLQNEGLEVQRVINITDVGHLTGENEGDADRGEDKLVRSAFKESKSAWDIAKFYSDNFVDNMDALGLIEPRIMARATDYIEQQLELIRMLQEKGYTYTIDDGIYFDTSKFKTYADFAHLDLEGLKAGARVEYNTQKRNPSDFALWKFSPADKKRDMEWETPSWLLENSKWNMTESQRDSDAKSQPMGFPGWHIECSAMVMSLLGETIDIHTGGIDHIPVHHTNEIAQSEAATGKKLSNFWLHNNHLKVSDTKISKSLDNGFTLEDLEAKGFTPLDYKMFVLQTHYRSEGNFTFDNLSAAKNRLDNWKNIAALRHQTHDTIQNDDDKAKDGLSLYATSRALIEALQEDINTPKALTIIDEAFTRLAAARLTQIHRDALVQLIETIDDSLGLQLLKTTPDISDKQKQLLLERSQARLSQDWKKSDSLRDKLQKSGISLRDTASDIIWEYFN